MSLADLQLRNVQELMDHVTAQQPITPGSVTLVVVDQPSTKQHVLAVRRLDLPAAQDDWYQLSHRLHDEMQTLPIPPWRQDERTIVVTVIGRSGFNVWTSTEGTWAMAWRYSNHLTSALDGDIIVVTEHGWAALLNQLGAPEPRLTEAT